MVVALPQALSQWYRSKLKMEQSYEPPVKTADVIKESIEITNQAKSEFTTAKYFQLCYPITHHIYEIFRAITSLV